MRVRTKTLLLTALCTIAVLALSPKASADPANDSETVQATYLGHGDNSVNDHLCTRYGAAVGGACIQLPPHDAGVMRVDLRDVSGIPVAGFLDPAGVRFCGTWSGTVPATSGRMIVVTLLDAEQVLGLCGLGSGPGVAGVIEVTLPG